MPQSISQVLGHRDRRDTVIFLVVLTVATFLLTRYYNPNVNNIADTPTTPAVILEIDTPQTVKLSEHEQVLRRQESLEARVTRLENLSK